MSRFITISELSKILNLVDRSTNKPLNHVLRYWEKQFKQINPKKINNRRYYSAKQVEIVKLINLDLFYIIFFKVEIIFSIYTQSSLRNFIVRSNF